MYEISNGREYAIFVACTSVLVIFYGIYFAKMLVQKRQGVQTRQIGRVKEKSVHRVEVLMSIATLAAPVIQIMSIIFGWNHMPVNARFTGFLHRYVR